MLLSSCLTSLPVYLTASTVPRYLGRISQSLGAPNPTMTNKGALCQPRWSIGQCELLQQPAGQSRPVRHNPACWPAAPFFAHPNRIIRDLHHRKLLDEPSPIDRNHHLHHDPSQAKPALTVTRTPSRSHGVQNRYPCLHHHRSPAAKRARPQAGDQAEPRAYGALRPPAAAAVRATATHASPRPAGATTAQEPDTS